MNSTSVNVGQQLGYWTMIPFACMLLAIALLPVLCGHWFERNRNKALIALALGTPTLVYLLTAFGHDGLDLAAHTGKEYVSFIVLLFALFTISGGIHLTGNSVATPRHNLTYLGVGAILANFIGTMGASMVLIRPLLRANSERKYARHTVVFFIFVVSNVAGILTPLGDPPLFLGFLRGVPFWWTLHLWPQWLLTLGLVLLAYTGFELYYHRREPKEALQQDVEDFVPVRIQGWVNLIPLTLVIVAVLFADSLNRAGDAIHFPFVLEVILIGLALISHHLGPQDPRERNDFCWPPFIEVAILFAGIFATMAPALALLEARGGAIGLTQPWQYFWGTGILSGFLDNAPTYLTFTSVAQGQISAATGQMVTSVGGLASSAAGLLAAISCGAVFMGANTYIGNAPNFAVKSIAERSGVKMPSFFGYMAYSCAVLVPIFVIVTLVFFR